MIQNTIYVVWVFNQIIRIPGIRIPDSDPRAEYDLSISMKNGNRVSRVMFNYRALKPLLGHYNIPSLMKIAGKEFEAPIHCQAAHTALEDFLKTLKPLGLASKSGDSPEEILDDIKRIIKQKCGVDDNEPGGIVSWKTYEENGLKVGRGKPKYSPEQKDYRVEEDGKSVCDIVEKKDKISCNNPIAGDWRDKLRKLADSM